MSTRRTLSSVAIALALASGAFLVGSPLLAQAPRPADVQFKAAQHKEEVEGDLKGAIEEYAKLAQSRDRAIAAKALVRMADCYHKLGDPQSRAIYERVVREFADQKEAAAEARVRLGALAGSAAPAPTPARRLIVDWRNAGAYGRPTRDGRHLLRYNEAQRAFELVDIGSGNVRRLAADGPSPAEMLVIGGGYIELSPDGRRLAAMVGVRTLRPVAGQEPEFDRGELRVFEVGGRGPGRVLATWDASALGGFAVRPFAWSPRNDRIWLWIMRRDQSAQIASVDMNGRLEPLKTLTWRDHSQPPSLSPDGRFVAYHDATDRQTPPDLYILATDGSGEQRIEHPANDSKPMFAPDGSGLVFESDRRGVRDLWYLPLVDGRPAGEPRLVWRDVAPFGQVERFADTGSLFFWFAANDWSVYTVALDLNAPTAATGERTRLAPALNEISSGPAFSPDGRYLAHFRALAARIVIRELATGREREIPFGAQLGSAYAMADWCPRGDVLIATGYITGTGPVAYRVSVNDTSVQRLPIVPYPYISPTLCVGDGEEVIYVPVGPPGEPRNAIIRRSLVSGQETILFKGTIGALARSADRSRLAFVTGDPNAGMARLVTMAADGGELSADLMTSGMGQGQQGKFPLIQNVAWMPDGDRLLVVRYDEGESFTRDQTQRPLWLWEVALGGGAPRKLGLLPLPKVEGYFNPPSSLTVHPDGRRLAFQSHEGNVSQTWSIENLLQFIKANSGS